VSAWGSSQHPGNSAKDPSTGKKEQHWPSTEAILTTKTVPPVQTNVVPTASNQNTSSSKVKTSGREKWVPFEAEIRISTNSNTNRKKSSSNGSSSNANGKKKGGNNNGQKSKSNSQQKKETSNASTTGNKQRNDKSNKSKDNIEILSNSGADTASNKRNSQKSTPSSESAKLANKASIEFEKLQINGEDNANSHNGPHGRPQFHRNSEPNLNSSNLSPNPNFRSNNNHTRRYQNKQFAPDNYRHSISGANAYNNTPFVLNNNFNYGYSPFFNSFPQPQFSYSNTATANTYHPRSSRSSSHSPARNDFNSPISGPPIAANAILPNVSPNFLPPNVIAGSPYTYVQDPISLVVNQLNYYFSQENLVKDLYLRKQMNSKGLVSLKKLMEFKRLNKLANGDISLVYTAVSFSPFLELINDKVRVREGWESWVLSANERDVSGEDETEEKKESQS
jgi:la-related protein 1